MLSNLMIDHYEGDANFIKRAVAKRKEELKKQYLKLINKLCPPWIYYLIDRMLYPIKKQITEDKEHANERLKPWKTEECGGQRERPKEFVKLMLANWKEQDSNLWKLNNEMERLELQEVFTDSWHERSRLLKQYIEIYRNFTRDPCPRYNIYKHIGAVPEEVQVYTSGFAWTVNGLLVFVETTLSWQFEVNVEQIQKEKKVLEHALRSRVK